MNTYKKSQNVKWVSRQIRTLLCVFYFVAVLSHVPTASAEVPVLIPVAPDAQWITPPDFEPIKNPQMKWADESMMGRPFSKDPSVIRFRNRYLMYFSLPANPKERQPWGWTCGIAESHDLVHWKMIHHITPLSEADKTGLAAPFAMVWNDKVYLFYQSYGNSDLRDDGICLAWSDDGINFTAHSKNPIFKPHGDWTNTRAIDADACVFKNKLFLYAATRDPSGSIQKIVVATADPEGLKDPEKALGRDAWTQAFDGAILEPQLPWETRCIEATTIVQRGDSLIMFYAGGYNNNPQQIGVAKSNDGIHWTRLWNVPFIPNGPPGQWNSAESGHPGAFVDADGRTYLFYQGNPGLVEGQRIWNLSQVEIGWNDDVPYVKKP